MSYDQYTLYCLSGSQYLEQINNVIDVRLASTLIGIMIIVMNNNTYYIMLIITNNNYPYIPGYNRPCNIPNVWLKTFY